MQSVFFHHRPRSFHLLLWIRFPLLGGRLQDYPQHTLPIPQGWLESRDRILRWRDWRIGRSAGHVQRKIDTGWHFGEAGNGVPRPCSFLRCFGAVTRHSVEAHAHMHRNCPSDHHCDGYQLDDRSYSGNRYP